MIIDYIPKRRYPKSREACQWLLRAATVAVLVGIYEFQVNEVGILPRRLSGLIFRYCGGCEKSVESLRRKEYIRWYILCQNM